MTVEGSPIASASASENAAKAAQTARSVPSKNSPGKRRKISRRKLLRDGWKAGGGLLAVVAGWTSWELLRPLAEKGASGKIKLGGTADYQPGTATYIREGRLWLVNADNHFFALSQKCPHLGCRVPFCESSGHFECPCHGSVYDLGGEWIHGPAPRGMDRFTLGLEGDAIVVDTSKTLEGPDHGANKFLKPPKGPSCAT
jgi:cytochrome b6-f complex iron-sulfur subunit